MATNTGYYSANKKSNYYAVNKSSNPFANLQNDVDGIYAIKKPNLVTNNPNKSYFNVANNPNKSYFNVANNPKSLDSSSGSSGSANYSTPAGGEVSTPAKIDWQNKSIDEMASILGLENYKYADILNLYNNTTNKKFDEIDTQTKRTQADNLRALEGNYDTYLNQLRQDRANAIGNGITKGASAAMQLATMYANADTISKDQQAMQDVLFDLNQQRGTALETNATTAMTDRRAIEQYLGTLRGTYEANSVNELAAKLAANAQVESARTQANATVKAAGIGASTATAAQDKVLQYYVDAANGNYQTGLTNYLAQLERDSRTNETVAKYQIKNNK